MDLNPDEIWRTWGVVERREETADVVAFVVRRTDPRPTKQSLPGQDVSLKMIMKDGIHQLRQHSPTAVDDGAIVNLPSNGSEASREHQTVK